MTEVLSHIWNKYEKGINKIILPGHSGYTSRQRSLLENACLYLKVEKGHQRSIEVIKTVKFRQIKNSTLTASFIDWYIGMKLIKLKNVSISVVVPSLHKSKFMSKIFDVGTLAWKTYSELKWKPEWTSKNWKMIYLIAWPTTVARLKNFVTVLL